MNLEFVLIYNNYRLQGLLDIKKIVFHKYNDLTVP